MIKLLSAVGEATIVIAAISIIIGSVIAGYLNAAPRPELLDLRLAPEIAALIGLLVGIIAAGVVFGPLATLYDIRNSMRRLVELEHDLKASR